MKKILIVDDVDEVCLAYEAMLSTKGYDVVTTNCGRKAIGHVAQSDFDVVITDLLMPDGDGFELALFVMRMENRPKIVMVSGGGMHMNADQALSMSEGLFDVALKKPVEPEHLINAIEN